MTSRERVMKMLDWELPDRVPMLHGFWGEWTANWRREKGLSEEANPEDHYQVDTYIAAGDETPYPTKAADLSREGEYVLSRDGWGQVKRTKHGGYFYEQVSFAYDEKVSLLFGEFDPVDLPERYADLDAAMGSLKKRYCVFAKTGGPYLRTSFMRGEVPFLMDLAADPALAKELVMRTAHHLAAIGVEEIRRWSLQDTGIWIYDDMAAVKGPMFSPETAEKILAPAWKHMIDKYREAGAKKVVLHSDGAIGPLLDLMIDLGFDGINPVEFRAGLDPVKLRERYGSKLCLLGGLDNAGVLVRGDPEEVRRHVLHVLSAGQGGGLALGTHSISPDISVATWDLVYETWLHYGAYPMELPAL